MRNKVYISYNDYELFYDIDEHYFEINVKNNKRILKSEILHAVGDCSVERMSKREENVLSVIYEDFTIVFTLRKSGITIQSPRRIDTFLKTETDTFVRCLESGKIIEAAIGPAVSKRDNCLYNRSDDTALCIDGDFDYNYDQNCYTCKLHEECSISLKEKVLSDKYGFTYRKINKNCTFPTPPAGWMTWYAVKFDASEETVLENLKWQKENLKDYGANTLWIDWEWYHNSLKGTSGDGADTFNPDPEKYPHGLKYIADKIKEAGFIPSLWIGFTNDCKYNSYTKENPEIILAEVDEWCGKHFYDLSHPKYINEFLPKALRQVLDWGYEAVKFDTLPATITYHEKFHANMYNPNVSTKEAFRNAMLKTREVLGENMYMLSCSCEHDCNILWAADVFDGARVGQDIFAWDSFLKEGVERVLKFYPMHNTVLYADPDNVVLREEYNTYNQAASRIYFVSMLGLPLNFGDDLPKLDEKRVDLLKECLPILDVYPKNTVSAKNQDILVTNLNISLPYEKYNVISVFNTTENAFKKCIDVCELGLEDEAFLVFDFTDKHFVGEVSSWNFNLEPCETKIFCIRRKTGNVQFLSSSRHITQGAVEVKDIIQNSGELTITASLIKNEPYYVYLYVPDGFSVLTEANSIEFIEKNVAKFSYVSNESCEHKLSFKILKDNEKFR